MLRTGFLAPVTLAALALFARPAAAYIDGPPASLGMMCHWSTHVIHVQVDRVERDKGIVVFRKLKDCKGKWPGGDQLIRQNVGLSAAHAYIMEWAEVGKTTMIFALESYRWCHTYIDKFWYASNTPDWQWWTVARIEPFVLRTYCGRTGALRSAAEAILAGREVIAPCMSDAKLEDLMQRKAKVQRLRASLKLLDHNEKRDFVDWGGDDFVPITGMPGFTHQATLARVGAEAQAISIVDFDSDGRPDVCLVGANRTTLLQNARDAFPEIDLPGIGGARAAVWADYNGDGKPDLFAAACAGPKLFTNLGTGLFRDDSHLLPNDSGYRPTAAAWIDADGDGLPDLILGDGFRGLRLFRNGGIAPAGPPPKAIAGKVPPAITWTFTDHSEKVGLGPTGPGGTGVGDGSAVADVNGDGRPDILYGSGTGLLLLNTPDGFREAKDSGIVYRVGKVGPVFGDFDHSGSPGLFVPQLDGTYKLFKNDGKGRFADVTARSGLGRSLGLATCAAWGDLDNDGHLDLVVGCLKSSNRYFRGRGDGTFEDATEKIGLNQRIYNTQAVSLADLNRDGALDMVFNNERQDAVVLLGDATRTSPRTPVVLGAPVPVGGQVRVYRGENLVGCLDLGVGEGRGGQSGLFARFALDPGDYRVELRTSAGRSHGRELAVAGTPLWEALPVK